MIKASYAVPAGQPQPLPKPDDLVMGKISRSVGVVMTYRNEQQHTFSVRWPSGVVDICGLDDVLVQVAKTANAA